MGGAEGAAPEPRPAPPNALVPEAANPALMARRSSGQVEVDTLADGTRAYRLRFRADGRRERLTLHERRDCDCGCKGGWSERTARVELENVLARVRAGVWQSPARANTDGGAADPAAGMPTFHEYASWWLQAKADGVIGHKPIDATTRADYPGG